MRIVTSDAGHHDSLGTGRANIDTSSATLNARADSGVIGTIGPSTERLSPVRPSTAPDHESGSF